MKNYAWVLEVRPGYEEEYKKRHRKVEALDKFARKLDIPLTNLALGWCLKNENVSTVILGASKIEQLSQNLNTLNYMNMINENVMGEVDKILQN